MNHKGLKWVFLVGLALMTIGCFAPVANAGWWWGAAPEGCGYDCGGFDGGSHHGCHRGCHYGVYHPCSTCGCCTCACGYGGHCWTSWTPCTDFCYPTWTLPCYGGCFSGGAVAGSCGCGGVSSGMLMGTSTIMSNAVPTVPAPTTAPTTTNTPATGTSPALAPPTAAPSAAPASPAGAPAGVPPVTAPSPPESGGGLPLPTPGKSSSLGPTSADSGLLTVWVPYEAKVTINGMPTKSTGSRRQFVSYGLKPGYTYTYEVKAEVARERPWSAGTAFAEGQVVRNQASGNFYVCVTSGTSDTSSPDIKKTEPWVGENFQDGSVTWRNVGPDYRGPGYHGLPVTSTQTVYLTAGGREGVAFGFNMPTTGPVPGATASNY